MVEETKTENAVKADEPTLTEEDLKAVEGVKERLKFFFSDANIRQDTFIRKLLMNEKSVGVDVMLRFNTIKKHTEKASVLVHAAKELAESLVVDEEKKTISRVVPFTNEMMKGNIPKSLYIRNLPVSEAQYDVKMDDIRALFGKYGEVALVSLKFSGRPANKGADDSHYGPASQKKKRKFAIGAAAVEFEMQEGLDKAAAATLTTKGGETVEPTDKITLAGKDIDVILLTDYIAMRKEESGSRGDKKRSKPEKSSGDEPEKETPKFVFDWKPGCVIKVRGLSEGCDREALLSAIGKALDISIDDVKERKIYVDYSRGQKDGAIRFPEPSDSVAELAKNLKEGKVTVCDDSVEDAVVLDGEDEKKYWEDFIEFKTKQLIQRVEEKKRGGNNNNKRRKMGR
jgi:RNA recognition motif-containing protein